MFQAQSERPSWFQYKLRTQSLGRKRAEGRSPANSRGRGFCKVHVNTAHWWSAVRRTLGVFGFFVMGPSLLNYHVPNIRFRGVRLGLHIRVCSIPRFSCSMCSLSGSDEQHCDRNNLSLSQRNEMRGNHGVISGTKYLRVVYAIILGSLNLALQSRSSRGGLITSHPGCL